MRDHREEGAVELRVEATKSAPARTVAFAAQPCVGRTQGEAMRGGVVLWRRLDGPGHDACCLEATPNGWKLDGTAVFRDGEAIARLNYRVACDPEWRTQEGEVAGWLGSEQVRFRARRTTAGGWMLNEAPVPELADCVDLDLGFTPATNAFQIRRIGLAEGQSADVPVAWLDVRAGTLTRLDQRYERRDGATYWYAAPRFKYSAVLQVNAVGLVLVYPGLWEAETSEVRGAAHKG
jgi:uncharacterized protein